MKLLGNLLWFVFGGLWMGLGWSLVGLLWCITIVGIPVGMQCFKLAGLAFFPFGKVIVYGGGAPSLLMNLLWLLFGGFALAISAALHGLLFCITTVGIPFGMQGLSLQSSPCVHSAPASPSPVPANPVCKAAKKSVFCIKKSAGFSTRKSSRFLFARGTKAIKKLGIPKTEDGL